MKDILILNGKKKHIVMGNFRMKNFTGLSRRAGSSTQQGSATKSPIATTPVTQRSKSPLKMNADLVAGAAYAAKSFNNVAGNMKPTETNRPATMVAPPAEEDPKTLDLSDVNLDTSALEGAEFDEEEETIDENDL